MNKLSSLILIVSISFGIAIIAIKKFGVSDKDFMESMKR